jgi:protein SCO1/2
MNGIVFALTVVVLVVAAFLVARHYFGPNGVFTARQEATTTTMTPAIGGPFTLVNQFGETVTDADFRGQYMLVYFGYTFCPDICPTSLNRDSQALDLLGEQA